jgi:hypothetical protein
MRLKPLRGSYSHGQVIQPGGFDLVSSGNPLHVRDGTYATSKLFTVTRTSAGRYTVTWTGRNPIPALPFVLPQIEQAATPTTPCQARYVVGSWNQSARTFEIAVDTVGTTPAASDGDAGDRVTFLVIGAWDRPGVDPA